MSLAVIHDCTKCLWVTTEDMNIFLQSSIPSSLSFHLLICGRVWSPGTGRAVPSMPLSPPTLAGWCASQGAGRQANHWVCGNGAGSSLKECLLAAQRRTCGLPGLGRKLFFSSSALQSSHFQEMTPPLEIPEPSLLPFPSCVIPSPSPAHTLQTRAPVSPCRSFSPWPQLPL